MNTDEAREIMYRYGKVLSEVTSARAWRQYYPAFVYPKNLLPLPKEKIRLACAIMMEQAASEKKNQQLDMLEWCLSHLDRFIDAADARKRNSHILRQMTYTELLKKQDWLN